MKKYNLLLVEDDPFTKQTLYYELKRREEINFLGAFDNGKEAVEYVKTNTPDIILMDIDMPIMNGLEATKEIKKFNPNILITILSNHDQKDKVLDAFSFGANAYCVKQIKMNELIKVFNIVSDGGIWIDSQIAGYIFDVLKNIDKKQEETKKTTEDYNITERERNVLKLVADGHSNTEIAEQLIISQNTVKNHIASLLTKLAVKDRTQIAVFALKNNLLD